MDIELTVPSAAEELLDFVDLPEEELEEELEEIEEEEDLEEDPEEDSEEDSEEEPEEDPEEDLIEIVIDDETYEVNLEELKSGYLRNEELVKAKEKLDELVSEKEYELLTERDKLVEHYNQLILEDGMSLQQYKNIDWEKFRQQDPENYREWRIKYIEAQEVLQSRLKRRDQIATLHTKQQELRQQAYVVKQQKLALELIPELEDPTFIDEVVSYGESVGFSREEILAITEAKQLFVLKQAMENSRAKVQRAAAIEKKEKVVPKVVKPGTPTSQSESTKGKNTQLRAKLNSTHSLKDAAAVLLDFV